MQRRRVEGSVSSSSNVPSSAPAIDIVEEKDKDKPLSISSSDSSKEERSKTSFSLVILTVLAFFLLADYIFVSQGASNILSNTQVVNEEKVLPSPSSTTSSSSNNESTTNRRKMHIPSTNVDGQKLLRLEMLKLRERQDKGLDLNTKIRTRWEGHDVAYWGKNADKSIEELREQKQEVETEEKVEVEPEVAKPAAIIKEPPNPLTDEEVHYLVPTSGKHRSEKNAIFGFAQGYDLEHFLNFIESLHDTGYTDDVVLSLSKNVKQEVLDYLATLSNVIAYVDEWDCIDKQNNRCKIQNLYGNAAGDHRAYRPMATARYEFYYAWSKQYSPTSWIMLIDFRDTYFQLDPFNNLDSTFEKSTLVLFEENTPRVTLGKSTFNHNWLKTAYGIETATKFSDYPVICSGTTLGTNDVIDVYLRGMMLEYDETKCILKGCDQGFHNYLYYSKKLESWINLQHIQVFQQGKGLINNLAALRDTPLKELKILNDDGLVLNWDGSVSAVAHQFDRDDELKVIMRKRKREFNKRWNERKQQNILTQ